MKGFTSVSSSKVRQIIHKRHRSDLIERLEVILGILVLMPASHRLDTTDAEELTLRTRLEEVHPYHGSQLHSLRCGTRSVASKPGQSTRTPRSCGTGLPFVSEDRAQHNSTQVDSSHRNPKPRGYCIATRSSDQIHHAPLKLTMKFTLELPLSDIDSVSLDTKELRIRLTRPYCRLVRWVVDH